MQKEEIELTQEILKLANELNNDRVKEREIHKKYFKYVCFLIGVLWSVFIISEACVKAVENIAAYNYELKIENTANANIGGDDCE